MEINTKSILKEAGKHVSAILFFLLITVVFFGPQFSEGKVLNQHDVNQFKGASEDLRAYYENEGKTSEWTGGMFSGMPAYQIGVWDSNSNLLHYIEMPIRDMLGSNTAAPIFMAMAMAYILFLVLGFKPMLSIMGAIAYAFSSYNFIIIDAGHVTKAWTIAYMPIVVAGMLAMFKNKYLLGGLCMAIGLAMQIKSNHLQITYYTGILCAILYIGLVVQKIKNKEFKPLLKSSGILAAAVALALLANATSIYSNYEMSVTSTRGKSELTDQSNDNKQTHGLDKDYVFGWSYGKAETLTLLIPNFNGGPSVTWLDPSSNLAQAMQSNGYGSQVTQQGVQGYTYWGDQPMTSGPVYFGAIICFLFLLGMIIIRNPLKWWLLGATAFFILLAWGKNFTVLNDLMYNYFPLYTKFRAVSQALVIPALTMVIVAMWGVKEFISSNIEQKKLNKALYISAGVVGGLCLLFWILPNAFFNFTSANDMQWREQLPAWFYNGLIADRKDLLSSDALRSLVFILISVAILWYANRTKNLGKKQQQSLIISGALALLILVDLWSVDKRYLGSDKFVEKRQEATFKKSAADEAILQDKDLSYRVLNLNNPFNETITSFHHRSVGGYHAAKLMRYQQLIERRLQSEIMSIQQSFQTQDIDSITANFANLPTLNMLDTRYMIFDPNQPPLHNPYAMGNAWFVDNFKLVKNADEEVEALNRINPRTMAVIDERFANEVANLSLTTDSTANIQLTAYKPNKLTYKTNTQKDQLAIFSEIYYEDGWNAYVDGKLSPHFRADWTLRAMVIPAGEHEIVFKFEPTEYYASRTVAQVSSGLLILLLIGSLIWQVRKTKEEATDEE